MRVVLEPASEQLCSTSWDDPPPPKKNNSCYSSTGAKLEANNMSSISQGARDEIPPPNTFCFFTNCILIPGRLGEGA